MNRRDFLRLRTTGSSRTLELSCRSLYMRYLDCEGVAGAAAGLSIDDHAAWMGEPPAVIERQPAEALWSQVEKELNEADVLRLLDAEWLAATDLRERVDQMIAEFRERGGRVE